jgi:hypothetical protein
MLITIDTNGTMQFVARDELAGLLSEGKATKTRASQVQPSSLLLRAAFRAIRWATGETGRLSDWTRNWRCVWQAKIVGGPYLGEFIDRADAIAAEIEWLESHDLGTRDRL